MVLLFLEFPKFRQLEQATRSSAGVVDILPGVNAQGVCQLLAHWIYLYSSTSPLPNWGEAAQSAFELLLPLMALLQLSAGIQRLQPLAKRYGIDINVNWCKI